MDEAALRRWLDRLGAGPAPTDRALRNHDLAGRVTAFRAQIENWITSGGHLDVIPLLALPAVVPAAGCCISCGATLAPGQTWRCSLCLEAVRVALGFDGDGA